jgi:poly(3-hydroxybutyrate) depolymerase
MTIKRLLIPLIIAAMLVSAVLLDRPQPLPATVFPHQQLIVADSTRHYRIVVPHDLPQPAPLLFAFHGTGDSTDSMADYTRLDELAARNGFLLTYPAASKSTWNVSSPASQSSGTNPDIRFFDQLLDHLSDQHNIDQNRIYIMGMSNGAAFAQLLTAERSELIAATVAHSGPRPREPVATASLPPLMLIVGEEDPVLTAVSNDAQQYRSQGHSVSMITVPGLQHEWSVQHNHRMWRFLSQHRLH